MTQTTLNGKVFAVTGGARGIGRKTVEALVAEGAKCSIGDIDIAEAEKAAREIGNGTIALPLNVTSRESFTDFLDQTESQLGQLFCLINNAGIMPINRLIDESDETMTRILDINVKGVILGSKLALQRMQPRNEGHLVNVASQAGKAGLPALSTYCASKFAVVGLCEALHFELRDTNINVSCIMPAAVNTELTDGLHAPSYAQIEPEDVAEQIVWSIKNRKLEVFVPRFVGPLYKTIGALPIGVKGAVARITKGDRIMTDALGSPERAGYEARAAQAASVEADQLRQ